MLIFNILDLFHNFIRLMKKIVPIFSLSSTQGKDVKMTAF